MWEGILATLLFWSAFAYSPGPFWSAIMQSAVHGDFRTILKQYTLYFFTGWASFCLAMATLVTIFGKISAEFIAWLHIAGLGVILWLIWKILNTQRISSSGTFELRWKAMTLITWANPKAWLMIPLGFLSATFSEQAIVNIIGYWLLGIPIFFPGLLFWFSIGKLGSKISIRAVGIFNIILLTFFASYIGWEGYQALMKIYA